MFDRVGDLAEKVATRVSRRHFLGSFGRWAGATALAMAGMLTTAGTARAGAKYKCCTYYNSFGIPNDRCGFACVPLGASCPPAPSSCPPNGPISVSSREVNSCGNCKF
jgi:hypothetical protein